MSESTREARGREADKPSEVPKRGWMDIIKRTLAEMKEDNIPVVAAGCAFYAWVALIPGLIALITIYGLVASPEQVGQQIDSLTGSLSPDTAEVIRQPIESATSTAGQALSIGLAVSLLAVLWSASGGMDGLIKGINIAYDEEPQSFPKRRGLAILLTLGAIVFLVLAVGLIAVVPVLFTVFQLPQVFEIVANVVRYVLLAVLFMIGLAVVYKVAPHRDNPKVRWVTWGAVVAAVLWLLGSAAFSFYVTNFGSYNKTYGALAGVIILNLWLFLTMYCVLLGAELNSEMEHQTRKDTTTGPDRPMGERDATKADHLGEATG
jgi:membrane protein